jgi:hypothetical protein
MKGLPEIPENIGPQTTSILPEIPGATSRNLFGRE